MSTLKQNKKRIQTSISNRLVMGGKMFCLFNVWLAHSVLPTLLFPPRIDPFDLCGTENISPAAIYLDHHGFEARKLNFPCNLCLLASLVDETVSSSLYIIARESRFRTNSGFFWLDNSWTTQLSGCDKSRVLLLTSMSSSLNDYSRDAGIYRDVGTGPTFNKRYSN